PRHRVWRAISAHVSGSPAWRRRLAGIYRPLSSRLRALRARWSAGGAAFREPALDEGVCRQRSYDLRPFRSSSARASRPPSALERYVEGWAYPVSEQTSETGGLDVSSLEVSVVMPCLNEADTLEVCIRKAQRALDDHRIAGEIVVADNGST